MVNPLSFALTVSDWQFFITLTYGSVVSPRGDASSDTRPKRRGGKVPSAMVRRRMLFQFLRKSSKGFACPMEHLQFIAREEKGERGGREHWHVLLGGVRNLNSNATTNAFRLKSFWEGCGRSAGGADVREYDPQLSGAEYVLKGLESMDPDDFNLDLANSYELSKFDDALADRKLILSHAWIRLFQRRANGGRRTTRPLKIVRRDRSARGMRQGGIPQPTRFPHPAAPENAKA